jgi:hypothetical protein
MDIDTRIFSTKFGFPDLKPEKTPDFSGSGVGFFGFRLRVSDFMLTVTQHVALHKDDLDHDRQ